MNAKRKPSPPERITGALLRKWPLPAVHPKLGKEGRGDVLVVGGSTQIPGAVILAAVGALRAGAGKLQIATARAAAGHVAVTVPEARVIGVPQTRKGELMDCDALLVGPGMVDPRAAVDLLKYCVRVRATSSFIVDAAALHAFDGGKPLTARRAPSFIITPHAGEMACLWGCTRSDVLASPLETARRCAEKLRVIVTLKGAQTYVVAPDGTAYHNTAGNVGLGTSGSGDTLSGVIAGLCARGATPLQA